MPMLPGVSIVVDNYNGAPFLRMAIDSALGQDHPDVEVIIVDDCSSDGSAEIIRSYGDRVRSVLRTVNGGQVVAINDAWPLATREIVIILDGDDALMPHAARVVAESWRPGIAKAQYRLEAIDTAGRSQGYVWPSYPAGLSTAEIRRQLFSKGCYPSVMACGNAYALWFLQRRGIRAELRWMDQMLEIDAPFFGEVVTLDQPLAYYRFHGQSDSMTTSIGAARFRKLLDMFGAQLGYLDQRCREHGLPFDLEAIRRGSLWYQELRLILRKLGNADDDTPMRLLLLGTLRALRRSAEPPRKKLMLALWQVALVAAPLPLARRILAYRFLPGTRRRGSEKAGAVVELSDAGVRTA